jgi:hypothetical protein
LEELGVTWRNLVELGGTWWNLEELGGTWSIDRVLQRHARSRTWGVALGGLIELLGGLIEFYKDMLVVERGVLH